MGLASSAHASLNVFMLASGATGGTISGDKLSVTNVPVGATVTMQFWAHINGADGNNGNDGLLSLAGSFLSTGGGSLGNLTAARAASPLSFKGGGSNDGASGGDLDGDGDNDVGSNNNADPAGFFVARSSNAPYPQWQDTNDDSGTTNSNAPNLLVATVKFVATAGGSATSVNFRKRDVQGQANWYEDATAFTDSDGNQVFTGSKSYDPAAASQWTIGTPVSIQVAGGVVPEPATLGVAGLGALGLLARRRK